jgi:plasmid replication initiation protein
MTEMHTSNKRAMNEKGFTIQSNDITNSRSILNLYERRVLNAIIQNVSEDIKAMAQHKVHAIDYFQDQGDSSAVIMKFKASDIVKHDRYKELRDALVGLKSKAVYIEKKGGTRITGFLNWAEMPESSPYITLSVDKIFYQTLFNLNNGYTIFQATVLNSLTSIHATKLYEVLARFRDKDHVIFKLDELRRLTNCLDKYPLYANFKRSVLEIAKKQLDLSKISDIRFQYKEIKERQQVTKIQFFIIKTENAHELEHQRNQISPYWDFNRSLVDNAKKMGINLKGKNLQLFKEYKDLFGEQRLASDLTQFIQEARDKGKGIPYLIGILKNRIQDYSQVKISYDSGNRN